MSFTEYLKMFMLFWTQLETSLGAIARIRGFNEETPDEYLDEDSGELPAGWPGVGDIEIKGLTAGYDERMVLKEVNISISGGEKVGICGRTGSGKSSLVLALLRMIDISSGSILIDGIDILTISQERIRSELNVISQEPIFFAGTLKHNLDPSEKCEEADMIQVLGDCQLGHLVTDGKSLDDEFKPEALSHGQKQLFCFARALLKKGRIVVLDEPTSNIDTETDDIVQRIIRENMKDKTVIVVAHRVQTITDFDKVVVMDEGKVVEVGKPEILLAMESKFKQLVEAA
ncbi:hypothetical protein ABW20_dc0100208 [Dactylellina cionopaga]|nr:hypothetical protein ABW20_dc0100208 [Dactylellina cionopaga]